MNGHRLLKCHAKPPKRPWNYLAVREAHKNNHTECGHLLDNDCPLPEGWRAKEESYTTRKKNQKQNQTPFSLIIRSFF